MPENCKTCGKITSVFDRGNGEKFIGCYQCHEPEDKCTCEAKLKKQIEANNPK